MRTGFRSLVLVLIGAILAGAVYGVYTLLGFGEDEDARSVGNIDNYIPAREIKEAPLFAFFDEDGDKTTLEKFRGKIVVLNMWATWCAPCVHEMPTLDRLQQQLKDLDVVVVALSIDSAGAGKVREFFDEHEIQNLEVYVDPSMRAQAAFNVIGLPTTMIIDKEGRERGRLVGPAEWDDSRAADLVLSAAAEPQ